MTTPRKVSISLISEVAAFFIPFLLGVYWAPVGIGFSPCKREMTGKLGICLA
jgi:hypothetical protein